MISNSVNRKIYIGQSQNIYLRIKAHINGKHNKYLSRAFEKYGLDKFDIQILEECKIDELDKKEQYWIDFYRATDKKIGYNICPIAGSTRGVQKSKKERERLRETAQNRVGNKNGFYGKHHNENTKIIIREKKTGTKFSVEQRNNVSNGHIGLSHSEETKTKIRNLQVTMINIRKKYKELGFGEFSNITPHVLRHTFCSRMVEIRYEH